MIERMLTFQTSTGPVAYDERGEGDSIVLLPSGAHDHHDAGRIVAAAQLTLQDAFEQIDPGIFHLEGLSAAGGCAAAPIE